jgi:hypothetical protein
MHAGPERVRGLLMNVDLDDADRAALSLLLEHRDGYWLGVKDLFRTHLRVRS